MTGFSEFVARLKAWQVFLLVLVPMFVFHGMFMSSVLPDSAQGPLNNERFDELMTRMMQSTFLMLSVLFAWLLSVGFVAHRRIAEGHRSNPRLALAAAALPLVYIAAIPVLWPSPFDAGTNDVSGSSMALIFPLHLLSMVGIFYVLRFAAKNLATAEAGEPVSYKGYTGTFFLLYFFPLGVWFVQPRVNQLVNSGQ